MKNPNSTNSPSSTHSAAAQDLGSSPWQRLKSKRISYLTVPLLVMATITEFVILATGWKYQQTVCLPKGMGVTFFRIGPIGATILAVELLKLPLAIWTASRRGWQKAFMIFMGLPLICVLTFQLVKDMAVYEMGVALKPASELLEKASAEEIKIAQLNGDLAAIEKKKTDREHQLAELAQRKAKAKADLDEALKRNDESRQDAISLTDYQKKELSEVEARQASIIKQFDADTAQLTKEIADLRTRREVEVGRAAKWNAEEARIDNDYKAKMAEYTNTKAAYDKAKAEYDHANFLKRQLMREPVDPGVPPVRESNTVLKPAEIAEIDAQIQAKEGELLAVNNKRRDRVAQVDSDARKVRQEFDQRSSTKREATDRKRDELLAAFAALSTQLAAEEKQVDQEFHTAAQKVDGIRAQLGDCRKRADAYYEEREASIKNTQVFRIATTVEIVRGLLFGKHPISITASAKERGDLYTDQISMVRIWVYPVLAFIVAFLPTLMVEIGFSTIFEPERQRPAHRLGFLGRRLHWVYTRAGRLKILRAERLAKEATAKIAARDNALAAAEQQLAAERAAAEQQLIAEKAAAEQALTAATAAAQQALTATNAASEQALAAKEIELQVTREAMEADAAQHEKELKRKAAEHEEQLQRIEEEHKSQLKKKEQEWVAKFTDLADSLNRAVQEKDALRDLQRSEVERQIQMRQNAWSDRLTQMRQELDDQRTAFEAERTTMMQEHQKKLMEVTEDSKTQVIQARRQMADAELAAVEKSAKLEHDLKEALHARDTAESQLKQQSDALSRQLSQAQEDAAREIEKVARQEKHRLERQRLEFEKTLRQHDEDHEHRLKQREQELTLAFDARLAGDKTKIEQDARKREAELERQLETRAREVDARWKQELQQREDAAQIRLKQREQQLITQAEVRLNEVQTQMQQESRRRESELQHQLDAQARDADTRLRQELQQKDLAFHTKLKQREQELTTKAAARETELQNQFASDLRAREEQWQREVESRVHAVETRLTQEAQEKEEALQLKLRQREQQWQSQIDARQAELQAQWDQDLHNHEQEWERNAEARARATESRWMVEVQQKEELFQSKLRQRDEQWQTKLDAVRAELQAQTEQELRRREVESADASLRALRELEAKLRQEMQQKDEAAQVKARQREQDLVAQLAAHAEARQAAEAKWETESEEKTHTIERLKTLLERAEKERDESKEFAADGFRQVQSLEKKLTEASAFLNGLKNGKRLVAAGDRNGF